MAESELFADTVFVAGGTDSPAGYTHVKFGTAHIWAPQPSQAEVQAHVEFSSEALQRAMTRLTKPGVEIREEKDIPLYRVDESNPHQFVRRMNGREDVGILQNGQFTVVG